MAKYALQDMIRIRTMREDKAGKELVVTRHAKDKAEQTLVERQKTLEDFRRVKPERRERLYATVMRKLVKREQLDILKEQLAALDEEEMLLDEAAKQAEIELNEKTTAAEKARLFFVEQSKNLMKIKSHKEAWEIEDRKEQERIEDAEMDEFTGKRVSSDDYDDFN